AASADSFAIASQAGAHSKDTWVLTSEPELNTGTDHADEAPVREADLIALPSRVVENLFWMGRYAERAEATLRLLRTTFMLFNGEEPIGPAVKAQLLQALLTVACLPARSGESPEAELQQRVEDGSLI